MSTRTGHRTPPSVPGPGGKPRREEAREGSAPRLRPLGAPRPAQVVLDAQGTPTAVMVGRRLKPVCAVRERWRIDDEWWRTPLARDYLIVILQDGRPLTLYRDLAKGGWWVQGEEG